CFLYGIMSGANKEAFGVLGLLKEQASLNRVMDALGFNKKRKGNIVEVVEVRVEKDLEPKVAEATRSFGEEMWFVTLHKIAQCLAHMNIKNEVLKGFGILAALLWHFYPIETTYLAIFKLG
ncbi:hypothetical protein ACJX0J_012708, partial [Zea mays]